MFLVGSACKHEITFFKAFMRYKSLNGLAPEYLSNKFNNCISTTHGINTRQAAAGQLALPPWSDGSMKMTLSVSSHLLCIVWNDSDTEIRNSVNMQTFKSKYKKAYCICSQYYDVQILLKFMFF